MHRIIINDKAQELLYEVKELLRNPGEKPIPYSIAVVRSLVIAREYAKATKRYGFKTLKSYPEFE